MSSIRLRVDQAAILKRSGVGAQIIRYAVKRWRRGDFVIAQPSKDKNGENLLQIYPLWRKPEGLADWQLRAILDAHWATPDQSIQAEIDRQNVIVSAELERIEKQLPYIIEDRLP